MEAIPTRHANHLTAMKMLKDIIFPWFDVPRHLMTDGGSHFKHRDFRKPLNKFGVAHRLVFFFEMGYPQPLHQTDAYGYFLLTLFRVQDPPKYSSTVTESGHMNQPAKKMAMLKHLGSNSIMQPPAAPVE
jgi:hypothetical protein